ncbi:hypothetical protein ADIARSV_0294 [Arcticibacter svalbardensis MN12-7]|uniref:DNA mimic protein DMP19 C-terminal domain-containing protein n=2 Tax=Arcticibacter TaxID=1288026 RepID=R9GYC8_9SPHI|nr:hypothetical protein ADIARSV_0294 [Arcticibacter svalbardensis MN12-7]
MGSAPVFAQSIDAVISSEMSDFKNRTIHSNLTTKVIDATPDQELVQVVKDNLLSKMKKSMKNEDQVFSMLSEPRQAIYTIWQVEAEVNNGGFKQLFSSPALKFAVHAQKSFNSIRAPRFAKLLAEVVEKEENGQISDQFTSFDEAFFALYDQEDLQKLKIAYIRHNKNEFIDN